MGTSLQVQPFAGLVGRYCPLYPCIFFNAFNFTPFIYCHTSEGNIYFAVFHSVSYRRDLCLHILPWCLFCEVECVRVSLCHLECPKAAPDCSLTWRRQDRYVNFLIPPPRKTSGCPSVFCIHQQQPQFLFVPLPAGRPGPWLAGLRGRDGL